MVLFVTCFFPHSDRLFLMQLLIDSSLDIFGVSEVVKDDSLDPKVVLPNVAVTGLLIESGATPFPFDAMACCCILKEGFHCRLLLRS